MSDIVLLDEVKRLVQCEREATASLIAHLAEVYRRKLYCAEGCSSMFTYCTQVLRLSENAAYRRITAAQMAGLFPVILDGLATGALNLTAIRLLAPYLATENCDELLGAARDRSKREIEHFLARRFPRPDVPALVRKLPNRMTDRPARVGSMELSLAAEVEPVDGVATVSSVGCAETSTPAAVSNAPVASARSGVHRDVIAPLAPERFKIQFTASAAMHEKLRHAQDLLRHRIPDGDLSQVFELALATLIERLEKQKLAATDRPRASRGTAPGSRVIPSEVKRAVWNRDGGRCAYIGKNQRRCNETGFLEFHHVVPFARGGAATSENIALRCRAHNQYESSLDFGPRDVPVVRETRARWGDVVLRASRAG